MNLESSILIKNNQIKSIDNIVNMQKININRYKDIIKRNEETIQSISNKNKTNKKIFFILGLSLGCAAYFF